MRKVSYIIPFKDWGLMRLQLAVKTALSSLGSSPGEVIVSDFGSTLTEDEIAAFEADVSGWGARYVRTETNGVWSRSQALNAGIEVAEGEIFVASDADMLVPPGCLERVSAEITDDPGLVIFLSCLDLPPQWDDAAVVREGIDWDVLRRVARRRPRWGMGLNAVSREHFDKIRGWDERFRIYGAEDNDFSVRQRRAGARVVWPEEDEFALLHMWHPPSMPSAQQAPAALLQVEWNKSVYRNDKTFVRNILHWNHKPAASPPLVSVVISTFNRRRMLAETIDSVLIQTMQDFEIIIVDDGSTDDTAEFVQSLSDRRIRYVRQDNAGIAAARNRGTRESRGLYIAVQDDDDLMLPHRLESQLTAQENSPSISFGTFVNFQDDTGEMVHMGVKPMDLTTASWKGGAPGHSTWMVPREWMLKVPYDETLTSGVDNDLALRFLRAGMPWTFCGEIVLLRRMHRAQVTVTDTRNQLGSASAALNRIQFNASPSSLTASHEAAAAVKRHLPRGFAHWKELVSPYLPDHLVDRWRLEWVPESEATWDDVVVESAHGKAALGVRRLTWADLVALGPEASLAGPLVAGQKGEPLWFPDPADVNHLFGQKAVEASSDLLKEAGAGSVAVVRHASDDGESAHSIRLSRAGGASLGLDSYPLSGRDLAWLPDWLHEPDVDVVVAREDLDRLREKWLKAVMPRRFSWRR